MPQLLNGWFQLLNGILLKLNGKNQDLKFFLRTNFVIFDNSLITNSGYKTKVFIHNLIYEST